MCHFLYTVRPHWRFKIQHGADSSNELPDLHTTQTPSSEVQASVFTEWPPACLYKLLPRGHQRVNRRKLQMKDVSNLTNICPKKLFQILKLTCNSPNSPPTTAQQTMWKYTWTFSTTCSTGGLPYWEFQRYVYHNDYIRSSHCIVFVGQYWSKLQQTKITAETTASCTIAE